MNKEIIEKIDEIIKKIENSELYQRYIFLKDRINNNKELTMLINEIKVLQKDTSHHLTKQKDLDIKLNELNNYPLYREYENTISDINNIYGIIENDLNNYFNMKFN